MGYLKILGFDCCVSRCRLIAKSYQLSNGLLFSDTDLRYNCKIDRCPPPGGYECVSGRQL